MRCLPLLVLLIQASCATTRSDLRSGTSHSHGDVEAAKENVDRRTMDHHFEDPAAFAERWNDPARDAWQKPEEIIAAAAIGEGDTVVDLGAGTGYLVPKLVEAVGSSGRVIAVDAEVAMVEYIQKAIDARGWNTVEARKSRHDDPTLAAESVDAIVTLNTWHHIDSRGAFAKKLAQALKPGGRLVVVDFVPEPTDGAGPPLEMRLSAARVASELTSAGLRAAVHSESLERHYIVVGERLVDQSSSDAM